VVPEEALVPVAGKQVLYRVVPGPQGGWQAQAGIARTNLQRNRELLAQAFISQSAVDQSAANLQVAEAQVALAQATMQRMRIVAPFDAVAGIRTVNQGDYVKDGADLVNLEDLSSMWIDFRLPERYLDRLKPGQPVEVSVDALPGRSFAARVGALDSQLEANGRSVLVRAELKDGAGSLRPGMFARARIVFGVRDKALVVPEEALVPVAGKQVLYLVVPGPQGGWQAQRLDARIGLRVPGKVEVLSGLQPGDRVVVGGQARLARGDNLPVRVVDIDRPAGAPDGAASRPAAAAPGAASGAVPAVRNGAPA
jgi:membrane fusion protein, multidrug efflux system